MMIGVVRPSTADPFACDQEQALRAAGCQAVFSSAGQPGARELKQVLASARRGDQVVVTTLDRLAGSLGALIDISNVLKEDGIDLVVLNEGVDTSAAGWRGFLESLVAVAEFERVVMSERTEEGLATARARGRVGGRRSKIDARQLEAIRQMYGATRPDGRRKYTVAEIALKFGVTRPTIYRHLGGDAARTKRSMESAI